MARDERSTSMGRMDWVASSKYGAHHPARHRRRLLFQIDHSGGLTRDIPQLLPGNSRPVAGQFYIQGFAWIDGTGRVADLVDLDGIIIHAGDVRWAEVILEEGAGNGVSTQRLKSAVAGVKANASGRDQSGTQQPAQGTAESATAA
ncbi:hypothetical protein J7J08_02525 [Stenotrophomonas sp. ISL-67]|uniref:hypothetical protein n=1 Tax=Stenotrophomonas sp. ISL-67 TaxID=2819171 RepID=UPI001BE96437|nr:hypothetical protein [Stenotrophomonas sp. ISL-67]MBT2766511.1 hypothetical protein [Stenotrophomonas sp. ISL-67]